MHNFNIIVIQITLSSLVLCVWLPKNDRHIKDGKLTA